MDETKIATRSKKVTQPRHNKRRKTSTLVASLPGEMIFLILVNLPADILLNTMRYVCKQWYNIIKDPQFIRQQLLVSRNTVSLLIQLHRKQTVYFSQLTRKKATLSRRITFPLDAKILSTCDGLVLFCYTMTGMVVVANLLLQQISTLPPIHSETTSLFTDLKKTSYSLVYVRSRMEYKVVVTHYCEQKRRNQCGVMTLFKDDSWRFIGTSYLTLLTMGSFFDQPVVVGSCLHWEYGFDFVTLDIESETFNSLTLPHSEIVRNSWECMDFVARGESLTWLKGYNDSTLWEVWVSSYPHGGFWEKHHVIDFGPHKQRLRRKVRGLFQERSCLRAVAWIDNDEVVLFRADRKPYPFITYNIWTCETSVMPCHGDDFNRDFINIFAPSLLWLN